MIDLPEPISNLSHLERLFIGGITSIGNPLIRLPNSIRYLNQLKELLVCGCELRFLPYWIGELTNLKTLWLLDNHLKDLPISLGQLKNLAILGLVGNPCKPDLTAANNQGTEAVMQYLRAKGKGEVALNEAKLMLVGEGEVGKSCLLGALRQDEWIEKRPTTHGIGIKPVFVNAPDSETRIILNGWDFGGQSFF